MSALRTAFVVPDGSVKNVKVISGHPLLTTAALEAVMQWTYRPTMSNDAPVQVRTTDFVVFPPPARAKPNATFVNPHD